MTATSFDSNILIDALNGIGAAETELESAEEWWISRVTWIEVMSGVSPASLAATQAMLASFNVDELTLAIATRAAELRNDRRRLKLADAVILASAQVNNRVLVTRNPKDFPETMPGIRVPYRIEQ